jgi:hypothetical protein
VDRMSFAIDREALGVRGIGGQEQDRMLRHLSISPEGRVILASYQHPGAGCAILIGSLLRWMRESRGVRVRH